ncbi:MULTISPECIES: type III-B CRISPR module-associated Cmr3 family protein [unclassified Bradyrhizobium]|uniref:type III-B CRISPR module-associated Cmr3 family protein n=1 Tax=unclassified Bradyrhizobium TaxID=2631580 RepID=UPI002916A7DA|nr:MULTISPECIES: type III-B CRISPR module-associated Cmr3 family protein [unclassified Bradyrhizobium]
MTKSALVELSPTDTLFLREGRPFDQLDAGLAEASSQFPPLPSTLAAMMALAMVRQAAGDQLDPADHNWYGDLDYRPALPSLEAASNEALRERLALVRGLTGRSAPPAPSPMPPTTEGSAEGASPATLRTTGPYLLRTTGRQRRLYVPWPSSLMVEKKSRSLRSVAPNAALLPLASDQTSGPVPSVLPIGSVKEPIVLERLNDRWIEWTAFCRHLADLAGAFKPTEGLNDFSVGRSDILSVDERIGIAIDPITGTARAGNLYAAGHIRLNPGFSLAVVLDSATELQPDWLPDSAPLGGEGRQVAISISDLAMPGLSGGQFKLFKTDRDGLRLRLTALTPVPVTVPQGLPAMTGPKEALGQFSGMKIVSAVVDRPRVAGIWRSGRVSGIRVVPAGSTWFVTVPTKKNPENAARQLADAATHLRLASPELAALGYGAFAIGNWP